MHFPSIHQLDVHSLAIGTFQKLFISMMVSQFSVINVNHHSDCCFITFICPTVSSHAFSSIASRHTMSHSRWFLSCDALHLNCFFVHSLYNIHTTQSLHLISSIISIHPGICPLFDTCIYKSQQCIQTHSYHIHTTFTHRSRHSSLLLFSKLV